MANTCRPAIRPGSQRVQASHPTLAFPSSEVSLSGGSFDSRAWRSDNTDYQGCLSDVRTTFSPSYFAQIIQTGTSSPDAAPLAGRNLHVRSKSFSTLDERHSYTLENDPDSVRVVINRQALTKRSNVTDFDSLPQLEIPIPHYRLGHPYFGQRGTPILRSSVYTRESGTGDIRSSYLSKLEYDRLFPHPVTVPRHSMLTRRHSEAFHHPCRITQNDATVNCSPAATNSTRGEAEATFSTSAVQGRSIGFASLPIAPEIFDIIAANPNDSTVVRYSSTGEMTAATPSRLIDHITSPSFLDYELLSDFFLTCRSFLKTADLLSYLVARLRWAVSRDNDYGRIVRVRTFVALRHWILNYFVDDFISDFALRNQFCKAVNDLSTELQGKSDGKFGDMKIIGELKKCWRRTCTLYWNNPTLLCSGPIEDDIYPGDSVNVVPNPGTPTVPFLTRRVTQLKSKPQGQRVPLRQEQLLQSALPLSPDASGNVKPLPPSDPSLASSPIPAQVSETMPLSPMSEYSVQAASCSIPRFVTPKIGCTSNKPQQTQSDGTVTGAIITPKTLRMYPPLVATTTRTNYANTGCHKHKRSGSFSDALRDERAPLSQPRSILSEGQAYMSEIPANSPTGSLVRGEVFPPIEPYVELMRHSHLTSTTQFNCTSLRKGGMFSGDIGVVGDNCSNDEFAMNGDTGIAFSMPSNPGVKRVLGSVRRAISGRQVTEKTIAGNPKNQTSKAVLTSASAASATASSSTTTMGGSIDNGDDNIITHWNFASSGKKKRRRVRDKNSAHAQIRVDILAAKAATSYNEALSTNNALQRAKESMVNTTPKVPILRSDAIAPRTAKAGALGIINTAKMTHDNIAILKSTEIRKDTRPTGGITSGSRSIVIANDTSSPDKPPSPSYLERQDSKHVHSNYIPRLQYEQQINGGSPVLPASPSNNQFNLNRENKIKYTPTLTAKCLCDSGLPILPLGDPRSIQYVRSNCDICIGTQTHSAQPAKTLPLKQSKSTRSQQSGSVSLRRYASYQNGITSQGVQSQHQPSISVDAVTFADVRSVSAQSSSPAPSLSSFPSPSKVPFVHKPHAVRQLRRRPGGNLRTFGNVHELERPRSTGSLSNCTHSISNSISYKPSDGLCPNGQPFSLGVNGLLRDNGNASLVGSGGLARRPYSLVQTHSSQPNLRPSFEAEVAKLAALPDEDDEGAGIEAALLKLEGRFEKVYSHALAISLKRRSERLFVEQKPDINVNTSAPTSAKIEEGIMSSAPEENAQNTRVDAFGNSLLTVSDDGRLSHRSFLHAGLNKDAVKPTAQSRKQSLANSEESDTSVPLLRRRLSWGNGSKRRKAGEDFKIGKLEAAAQTTASIERDGNSKSFLLSPPLPAPITTYNDICDKSGYRSKRESRSPSPESKFSRSPVARDSFLLDSDQSLSDVASDISTGDLIMSTISGSQEVVSSYDEDVNYELSKRNLGGERAIQDRFQSPPRHLPTSSSSEESIKAVSDAVTPFTERLLQQQEMIQQQQGTDIALNPDTTVARVPRYFANPSCHPINATGIELQQIQLRNEPSVSHPSQPAPSLSSAPLKHIPFILMYSSEILAQQFTIIEKDALDEIDWKELIELRWDQSARGVQNWVEYLLLDGTKAGGSLCEKNDSDSIHNGPMNSRQRRGVDTAIARFNLMVKWAVSECVLTEDVEERVRVLVKYIHIAAHARQLRNYATMYQITIALLSSDCSRLTRTWNLVPEAERETLRTLEKLVQPLRNFSNLRHEMETAPLEDGCIPFIGK